MEREDFVNSSAYHITGAAIDWWRKHHNDKDIGLDDAFEAGAEWMYEEFEKNRLMACENHTEEEREREEKFVMDFVNKYHRIPTISDAIELTRKDMIDKACTWLQDNYPYYFETDIEEQFRKAMKE